MIIFCHADEKEDNSTSGYEVIERTDSNSDYSSLDVYDMMSDFDQEMIQPDRTNAARTSVTSECSLSSPSLHAERTLDKDADFQLPQTNKVTTSSRNQEAKPPYRKTPQPRRKVMSISGAQTISPFILSAADGVRDITFQPTPTSHED